MKKINNLEFSSLIIIIMISMYSGININIIKNANNINGWICIIISNIINIIPILIYLYIAKFKENLSLNEKINYLFKRMGKYINFLLIIILINIELILLYNSTNFIISQLLYRTPSLMISIIIIIITIYHNSKGINSITRVAFLLLIFNISLFLLSFISLSSNIKIDNFLPVLNNHTNNLFLTSLKISSINSLPIIITLSIPKNCLENPNKFNKNIIISYIISSIISLIVVLTTYGVLGINLIKLYEYPEYIVLKKVTLFDFLERIENIIANNWIIGNYIYISLIMYYISQINIQKKNKINIINGLTIIILSTIIFKNNTIFHTHTEKILPYLTFSLFIIYIIISIKIIYTNKKEKINRYN